MVDTRMTRQKAAQTATADDTISFAELSGGIAVIRVSGRGSFANSVEMKSLADNLAAKIGPGHYHFLLDLSHCETMDSTFMGMVASIGLRHIRDNSEPLVIVNANDQTARLLSTLGLSHFINVRMAGHADTPPFESSMFQVADRKDVSKAERIIHMIEAHQQLCDIDSENVVRFEGVLKYLQESLEHEKNK
ncbi:MAG: STAS domain-containing protein [bacterium]|nr:STAS domain-containing protein [Candidatus Sumerlaeota bacterium]